MPTSYTLQEPSKKKKSVGLKILSFVLKPILLLGFPFWLMIRGCIFLYQYFEMYTWLAFILGLAITLFVLLIYVTFIYRKLLGKQFITPLEFRWNFYFTTVLLIGYCVFAMLSFSAKNSKHPEIQAEYTSLHPFLRLGVRTLMLMDKDLLITDAKRIPKDYKKMGLATKQLSLHYVQASGYSHAMDIRVNDRSEIRNFLVTIYFRMFGFNVIRHVGTADHLHVSLSPIEYPNRK
ncbi:hypothetical protein BC781_111122 [Sediminitomix flava]|uniref:Uncharacterized protein n=2 Tax=Sediminitomix flava TaxID=379075 RepID=A0A315YY26_SEDFL|nr:hypothetical protein BC781_111122 [Sediminitomix flava]